MEDNNIQELQGYSGQSMYSTNPVSGGRMPFGIGSLLMMLFGNKMWPLPNPNTPQSLYDGVWQRDHDMKMMQMARMTAANWVPFNNMGGINENSIVGNIATSMISQPDGIVAKLMNPILGGNPIEAQMASLASLQGISASGLGTTRGTTINELNRAREEFDSVFYNQNMKPVNQQRALEIRGQIEDNIKRSGIQLPENELKELFNSRNELNVAGAAYNKLQGTFGTVREMSRRATEGGYATEADFLQGLDLSTLGSNEAETRQNVTRAFHENDTFRKQEMGTLTDTMRKFDTGEAALRPFVEQLTKAIQQGRSKDELMKMFNDGIKLKGETLNTLKQNIEQSFTKVGDKLTHDLETASKPAPVAQLHDSMNAMSSLMTVQKLTRGVNYDNTLGFSYETLMGARNELLKNRLIAPTDQVKDLNAITRMAAGQGGGLPPVLDAARGIFGNGLSDKELINRFSEFVGYSDVNLAKESDRDRVESSMRTMKSVAREANVDIGTLLNIHQGAQNFASQNPNTSGLGGLELANMISQRTEELAAISTSPNAAKNIRLQGGTANLLNKNIMGTIKLAQSPMVTTFAAGHTYLSQLNDPKLMERYEQFLKGDSKYSLSSVGFQEFLKANVKDPNEAFNYSYNNAQAANEAWRNPRNADLLTNLGTQMQMKQYKAIIGNAFGGAKSAEGKDALSRVDKYIYENDVQGLLNDRKLNLHGLRNVTQHLVNTGAIYSEIAQKSPKVKAELEATREAVSVGEKLDSDIARRMGRMRAPTMQRIVQSVMSGEYSENGITQLLKDIGVSGEPGEYAGVLTSANKLAKINMASSVEDIAMQAGANKDMGSKISEFSKMAEKYGISGAGLEELAKGKSLDDVMKEGGAFDKVVANKSVLEKNPQDRNKLFELSKEISQSGMLKNFKGKFDTENVRKYFSDTERDNLIEHGFNTREVYKKVDDLYTSYAGTMSNKPATAQIGKALQKLSSGKEGVEGAFAVLDKAYGSEGVVDTGKEGDGRFALDETYAKLADAYYGEGKGTRTAKTKDELQKTQGELHSAFFKNSAVSRLMETHSGIQAGVEQAKKEASREADMGKMVQDILKKLDSLPQIATAINNVSETIAGKAHP